MSHSLSFDLSNEGKQIVKNSNDKLLILWGDEILANIPSCLEGGDNGINVT
jgi:hypothetical protein